MTVNRETPRRGNGSAPMTRRTFAAAFAAALAGLARPAPSPAADVESIYGVLGSLRAHTTLFVAAGEAEQAAALKGPGPLTLFAPTDDAFKNLAAGRVRDIATDPNAVPKLFQAHLAAGRVTEADLKKLDGREVRTLGGTALRVENGKDGLRVGGAKVLASIPCSNGVIHVIDGVLPVGKE
jgi:uncharacterized surface protein with fasciclin (FAS1) repeats